MTQFSSLTSINNDLELSGFSSLSLPEFPLLTSVGVTVSIHDNHFLHDLDSFPSISMSLLNIQHNDMLVSVSGLCGSKTVSGQATVGGAMLCCDAVSRVVQSIIIPDGYLTPLTCVVGPPLAFIQPGWANCGENNYFTCFCPSLGGPECPSEQICRDDSVESVCVAAPCGCNLDAALRAVNAVAPGLVR